MLSIADVLTTGSVGFAQRSEIADEVVVASIVRGSNGVKLMGHLLYGPTQEAGWTFRLAIHGDRHFCVEVMT
jgi:hypothetical protein